MPSGTSPSNPSTSLSAAFLAATQADPLASASTWSARLRSAADEARHVATTVVNARDDASLTGPAGVALTQLVGEVAHAVTVLSGTCSATADELAALAAMGAAVTVAEPAVRVHP